MPKTMPKAIFIHSTWRSSSTYWWEKFREDDRFMCFYEPFHPALKFMCLDNSHGGEHTKAQLGHPGEKPYWLEYAEALDENDSLPHYKRRFTHKMFWPSGGKLSPGTYDYIEHLLETARRADKVPVLGFVRSAGRINGIKTSFGGLNIGLVRNPYTQWQSYKSRAGFLVSAKNVMNSFQARCPSFYDDIHRELEDICQTRLTLRKYDDLVTWAVFYIVTSLSIIANSDEVIFSIDAKGRTEEFRQTLARISAYADYEMNIEDYQETDAAPEPMQNHVLQVLLLIILRRIDAPNLAVVRRVVGLTRNPAAATLLSTKIKDGLLDVYDIA